MPPEKDAGLTSAVPEREVHLCLNSQSDARGDSRVGELFAEAVAIMARLRGCLLYTSRCV